MKTFLFEEFNPISAKEWKQQIQYDLKGADYNEALVWKSPEGLHVKPFYHSEDLQHAPQAIPGQPNHWKIVQDVFVDQEEIAHKLLQDATQRGAEAILVRADKAFNYELLFKQFPFQTHPLYFELHFLDLSFLNALTDYLEREKATFFLQLDPIGKLASTGNWFQNQNDDLKLLKPLVQKYPTALTIHTDVYQNAGANIVQQLAYALAHSNEYLNYFYNAEISFQPTFKVAIGGNYFFEIAKIRALRKLYATLAAAYGAPETCHIIAEPSRRNKTLYDYNVNILRTTTECMSAVLGGADAVCNLAYDAIYHKSNEFGERIARNQLLILKEESYFDLVSNPADGAYYIETLTDELAEKALVVLKDIEKSGGFIHQLKESTIQKKIKESADKEQLQFNEGTLKLLGTNYHPNANDRMKNDLQLFPFVKHNPVKTALAPIIAKRLAEPLEQERLKQEES